MTAVLALGVMLSLRLSALVTARPSAAETSTSPAPQHCALADPTCKRMKDEAAGFAEYNRKFNPFNGTDAALLYSPAKAAAMEAAGARNDTVAAAGWLDCVGGWIAYGGYNCMYDTTARVGEAAYM